MKILFIANRVPFPPFRGDKLKIYNIAQQLYNQHDLHLIAIAQTKEELSYQTELEKYFKKVDFIYLPKWKSKLQCIAALWNNAPFQILYFHSTLFQKKIDKLLLNNSFDIVQVQHLRMAQYVLNYSKAYKILDLPDAFSLYWKRKVDFAKGWVQKIFNTLEYKRILKYERKVAPKFQKILACSNEDITYLKEKQQVENTYLLPNGVNLNTFHTSGHDYEIENTLLFTGNMDYAPNVDAVVYFVKHLLPKITAQFPSIQFIIAGQNPVPEVCALANKQVIVTGFVTDIAAYYAQAAVVVAPLRFGAGTQNKVLEAMAMGVPVVCTTIGFSGLGIENGSGAFCCKTDEEFLEKIIFLLNNLSERKRVGNAGQEIITSQFSWREIADLLNSYWEKI